MKKFISLSAIFALFFLFVSCNTEAIDETTSNLELNSSKVNDSKKNTGFDQWGYNWNAHQFNGYLINAWFGDELYPDAPWYKKEPPYNGDWDGYAEQHPEVLDYDFYYYGNMTLVMHWNESCISREGVYQYPIVDSDAWITFHYRAGEGENRWSQFQKFVAVKSTDKLVVYAYDDDGNPVFGEWFSEEGEGESVGLFYMWPDRALVQVVNTGNVPEGMLDTYKGLIGPGLGKYKSL